MKTKFLSIILLAGSLLTSCDMDLKPQGVLEDTNALETLEDAAGFRNGFYTQFRGFTSSDFYSYSDIQCNFFNGTQINGNRIGPIANGNIVPSDLDITGFWSGLYARIGSINFFLNRVDPILDEVVASEKEENILTLKRYIGEAHFFRGFYYAMLMDRFCGLYDESTKDTPALGVPLVTVFNPTSDRDTYPGRSTMAETLKLINDDLDAAMVAITDYEANSTSDDPYDGPATLKAPMSPYVSSNIIKALKARIALWEKDYTTALNLAKEVIDCGYYALATTANYTKMWTDDTSDEIMMRCYMSTSELSNSIGSVWISSDIDRADYVLSSDMVAAYSEGYNRLFGSVDVRYDAFMGTRDLSVFGSSVATPCFVKYPGNTTLRTGSTNNLMNMPKPFRLSEMYLIAAESAAALNNEKVANDYLLGLRVNRYKRGSMRTDTYTGAELTQQIRAERNRELIGEGFHMSDLRRWGQGFTRSADYENAEVRGILVVTGLSVSYVPGDYRYTWPIPSDEIQSNPNLQGQQNPGY